MSEKPEETNITPVEEVLGSTEQYKLVHVAKLDGCEVIVDENKEMIILRFQDGENFFLGKCMIKTPIFENPDNPLENLLGLDMDNYGEDRIIICPVGTVLKFRGSVCIQEGPHSSTIVSVEYINVTLKNRIPVFILADIVSKNKSISEHFVNGILEDLGLTEEDARGEEFHFILGKEEIGKEEE